MSLSERPANAIVGQPEPHESADLHVTGHALYTDDLGNRYANLLHAWPLQSTQTHAQITKLEVAPALEVAGVVRVLTASDVPGVNDAGVKHDEPLFPSEVMYQGHAICWVLGETLEAARLGATAIQVEYETLPAIVTVRDAIQFESFQGAPQHLQRGEIDLGLSESDHVFEGEFEMGGQEHFYLETHASLAIIDESGQVFIQSSTQHPSETQDIVAHVLGLSSHQVTVQCLRMGGGFGGKEMQPHGLAAIAALGSSLTGRPVRVRLNRTQDLTMTGKRHPLFARWKVGFKSDGTLHALKAELFSDGGWSLDLSEPVLARALCHIDNAYFIPHVSALGRVCKTHKTSQTAFRGFGGPQGMLIIEDIMGRCAPKLGFKPEALRSRNFYKLGESTPYHQPVRDPERMNRVWFGLLEQSDFAGRSLEIEAFNQVNPHHKRGLAITPVKFGISFNFTAYNQAGALVIVYKDGSVLINHGGTEMGQGLHTKMIQVAATALGVSRSSVRLAPTRTDKVPNSSATAASTGADLNGAAIKDACDQIKSRLAGIAAVKLEVDASIDPNTIRFQDGRVFVQGQESRAITFTDLVNEAYYKRTSLWASGFYSTPGLHWDREKLCGEPFKYFAYGASVSEVEVDGFTGAYRLRRVDILHDVGESLSPIIDIGQIEGGFVQGTGWLTLEDLRWDTNGRLATQSASTYKLPSFSEMPEVFNVKLLEQAAESGVIYGSKAVGEPPVMLAMSVREALRQAASAFGDGPSLELGSPATPEAVFWAIEHAKQ
jgi:xanthine dehydrogenase large subunit